MKMKFKKLASLLLAAMLLFALIPSSVFASHRDSDGYPLDLNDNVVLSVYEGNNFPGEPNTHMNMGDYASFSYNFDHNEDVDYAQSATGVLNDSIFDDLVQGPTLRWGRNDFYVWGAFDTSTGATSSGLSKYFAGGAQNRIFSDDNETKMIMQVKNISEAEASTYEIVWYVVKYQTSDTAWHIDGIIRNRNLYSVNYYGNGNTSGGAPVGSSDLSEGSTYTVLGNSGVGNDGDLERTIAGVKYDFIGWNTKIDGSGTSYAPGDTLTIDSTTTQNHTLTLYAQWKSDTRYKATVNLFLDDAPTELDTVHPGGIDLHISSDNGATLFDMEREGVGVYSTTVSTNGHYYLYHCHDNGADHHKIGEYFVPVYNANGTLDINHYSVNYHSGDGAFANADSSYAEILASGSDALVMSEVPVYPGHIFTGYNTEADGSGTSYNVGDTVKGINEKVDLYAQYIDTVDVYVNVTINHSDGAGYDHVDTKEDVSLVLEAREDSNSPYYELNEYSLSLSDISHAKHRYIMDGVEASTPSDNENVLVSEFIADTATFTSLPGGTREYSVFTQKSGYDVTNISSHKENGSWIIDVELTFDPANFDFEFEVVMDDSVPAELYPDALVVKVTYYDAQNGEWKVISQLQDKTGIEVDINAKTGNMGSYPVWKEESGSSNAYAYRISVEDFIYDGNIYDASALTPFVEYKDDTYVASIEAEGGVTYASLNGAYFDESTSLQVGTVKAVVSMPLYSVTFDAQGGTIKNGATYTENNLYQVPSLDDYIPTHADKNYIFDGWYLEDTFVNKAVSYADLSEDITIYAKWKAPLTISGTVSISDTYKLGSNTLTLDEAERADKAAVLLERTGAMGAIDEYDVEFNYSGGSASATYSFTVPDDGTAYRIFVRLPNYKATFDNEPLDEVFTDNERDALFNGDSTATVNVKLGFDPDIYAQQFIVDADEIGEGFRPTKALAQLFYRDIDDDHSPKLIPSHVDSSGVELTLNSDVDVSGVAAEGSGSEDVWRYHFDSSRYEYTLNVAKLFGDVDGVFDASGEFDLDTVPFGIIHSDTASWGIAASAPIGGHEGSGVLKAELVPNEYKVTFDLKGGTMSAFENGGVYETVHTWSFETDISSASPTLANHTFLGFYEDVNLNAQKDASEAYITAISASTARDVSLVADYAIDTYTVTWVNYDGSELEVDTSVPYGSDPSYDGQTPQKPSAGRFSYTFKEWSPAFSPVTEDVTYTATFDEVEDTTSYYITYEDGVAYREVFPSMTFMALYGDATPQFPYIPKRAGYVFATWTPTLEDTVTGDKTYTAVWIRKSYPTYPDSPEPFDPPKTGDSENAFIAVSLITLSAALFSFTTVKRRKSK